MEYVVNSLKEAIEISVENIGYEKDNIAIIKKLILKALEKDIKPFTKNAGAREYVKNSLNNGGILKELKEVTNLDTNDINILIDAYINIYRKKC